MPVAASPAAASTIAAFHQASLEDALCDVALQTGYGPLRGEKVLQRTVYGLCLVLIFECSPTISFPSDLMPQIRFSIYVVLQSCLWLVYLLLKLT